MRASHEGSPDRIGARIYIVACDADGWRRDRVSLTGGSGALAGVRVGGATAVCRAGGAEVSTTHTQRMFPPAGARARTPVQLRFRSRPQARPSTAAAWKQWRTHLWSTNLATASFGCRSRSSSLINIRATGCTRPHPRRQSEARGGRKQQGSIARHPYRQLRRRFAVKVCPACRRRPHQVQFTKAWSRNPNLSPPRRASSSRARSPR